MMKEKVGTIVSNKMTKTLIVCVSDRIMHKRYGKLITRTKRYAVHNSDFSFEIGDKVRIRETRRISKTVSWEIKGKEFVKSVVSPLKARGKNI
jgi:small subunit ribosomal protein S17